MAAPLVEMSKMIFRSNFISSSRLLRHSLNKNLQKRMFNTRVCGKLMQLYSVQLIPGKAEITEDKELKKFFKTATLSQSEGWFEINLDQRKLRTPGGNLFKVPHEALAMAVATEWNAQENVIKRHNMHLTSLCNTAIDNPMRKSRSELIRGIIHFLETDTVSYRLDEPEDLLRLQQTEWDPVIRWIEQRYNITVPITEGIANSPDLPSDTRAKLERHLQHHSDWALFGYTFAIDALKSLVLTLAVMDKHISVEKAVQLSRLEQDYQTQRWGSVEWYHDIDMYELQCRLAAAALFVQWTSETQTIKQKASIAKHV